MHYLPIRANLELKTQQKQLSGYLLLDIIASQGARYLAGENLEVIRAKFSTLEDAVCMT